MNLLNLDLFLTQFFYDLLPHSYFLDSLFLFFSAVSTYGFLWLLMVGFLIIVEEIKHHEFLLVFLSGLLITLVVVGGLKNVFKRPRPATLTSGVRVSVAAARPSDYSFPSAHVASSFFSATILVYYLHKDLVLMTRSSKKKSKVRPFWNFWPWLLCGIAGLVAFSRIYLGVHYVADVIIGALIGVLVAKGTITTYQWLLVGKGKG